MRQLLSIDEAISEALEYVRNRVLRPGGACVIRNEHRNSRIVVEPNGRSFKYKSPLTERNIHDGV